MSELSPEERAGQRPEEPANGAERAGTAAGAPPPSEKTPPPASGAPPSPASGNGTPASPPGAPPASPPGDPPAPPPGAPPAPLSGKKRSLLSRALWALGLLLFGAAAFAAYDVARFMHRPPGGDAPKDVIILIAPGATFDRVAWDLYKAGAVSSVWRFRLLAQAHKQLGSIQAGEFLVSTGWKPSRVLRHLVSGRPLLRPLALREGLPWWEIAKAVEEGGFARAEAFTAVIHDPDFLRSYGIPFANAEGFLFPDTYYLARPRTLGGRAEAEAVARVLVEEFWRRAWPLLHDYAARSGESGGTPVYLKNAALRNGAPRFVQPRGRKAPVRTGNATGAATDAATDAVRGAVRGAFSANATAAVRGALPANATAAASAAPAPELLLPVSAETLRRLVILGTLVEKETGLPEERARVAGVYGNRLRLGMPLQCDPTILYGLGEGFRGPILKSHLADFKNTYNTYLRPGLPPGPICSPGLEALRAAAAPERHSYLYFVAVGGTGAHEFSATLEDHNRAVARYRAWQRQ